MNSNLEKVIQILIYMHKVLSKQNKQVFNEARGNEKYRLCNQKLNGNLLETEEKTINEL